MATLSVGRNSTTSPENKLTLSKPKILIQLDSDPAASVFDAVVAIDADVEHLLPYGHVKPEDVRPLVHGAIFTRGPKDLRSTAIFIGGSKVSDGELLLSAVKSSFFGPMRVSVLFDANGANTTAAAAVLAAARHVKLQGTEVLVLAATGPVGQRAVRLLAREGAVVRAASRDANRAAEVCKSVSDKVESASITPIAVANDKQLGEAIRGARVVLAAGAAGVVLVPAAARRAAKDLQVAIDLNAVPPLGIEGVEVMDRAVERDGALCYGAIGVGETKMRIHKAAIRRLFESNDQILDAEQIYAIGRELEA